MPWAANSRIDLMEAFTPRSLVAGRVSAKPGQELALVGAAAAAVLGTEQLALVYVRQQGEVGFLAAPAADLASHPQATCALAAALSGSPAHEGEGAYTADLTNGLQAVIVNHGRDLHSYVGTPDMVTRFIALEGVTKVHECTGAGLPWQFPAQVSERREARLLSAITVSALMVALTATASWLWAARSTSQLEALRAGLLQDQKAAWEAAVRTLEPAPYPKALANLNKAVEQAIREKGVLVQFEHKDERSSWTLSVNARIVSGGSN
jgi:hypothetical protein